MSVEKVTVTMNTAYVEAVKARWEAKVGDPKYDWVFDPNQDGVIDFFDLAFVNAHWGKIITLVKVIGDLLYHNTLEWEAETTKEFASNEYKVLTGLEKPSWDINLGELKQKIIEAIPEAVNREFKKEGIKKGYVFTDVGISNVKVDFTYRTSSRQFRDYTMKRQYLKAYITATIDFDSDKLIAESPIVISFSTICYAIALIILGYFVIQRLFDWLTSMTTKSYKIHTIKYDAEGNIIEETWEEGEEPSPIGIAGVGSILIILLIIVAFFMFGRRK